MPEKYQEEIEEILRGIEEKTPITPIRESERPIREVYQSPRDDAKSRRTGNPSRRIPISISPSKLAVVGLLLLVIGAFTPADFLIWVGLAFLVGTYLLLFIRPRSIRVEKRWRGQSMEEAQTPWQRFKRWLQN